MEPSLNGHKPTHDVRLATRVVRKTAPGPLRLLADPERTRQYQLQSKAWDQPLVFSVPELLEQAARDREHGVVPGAVLADTDRGLCYLIGVADTLIALGDLRLSTDLLARAITKLGPALDRIRLETVWAELAAGEERTGQPLRSLFETLIAAHGIGAKR